MKADSKLIEWLLFECEESIYKIVKESGVPKSTISDLRNKVTSIELMSFKNANLLTKYAKKIKH